MSRASARRPRYPVGLLLGSALAFGCVAENPDWDEGTTTSARGEMTTSATSDDSGSTGDGGEGESDSAAGDDSDLAQACLQMGLAACETDAMIVCVDVMTDVTHCGECFSNCAAMGGEACHAGICDCPGGPTKRICNGMCTDTHKDAHACGDACTDCTIEFGPNAECDKGKCKD